MTNEQHEHGPEDLLPDITLDDSDAVALVHTGRKIDFFLTVRYCPEHKRFNIAMNDDGYLGDADNQADALTMADMFIDGYLYARRGMESDNPHVDRVVHGVLEPGGDPPIISITDLRDLRN